MTAERYGVVGDRQFQNEPIGRIDAIGQARPPRRRADSERSTRSPLRPPRRRSRSRDWPRTRHGGREDVPVRIIILMKMRPSIYDSIRRIGSSSSRPAVRVDRDRAFSTTSRTVAEDCRRPGDRPDTIKVELERRWLKIRRAIAGGHRAPIHWVGIGGGQELCNGAIPCGGAIAAVSDFAWTGRSFRR